MERCKFPYAIFDMDGLMFDTENLYMRGFTEYVGPRAGMTFTREKMLQTVGRTHRDIEQMFPGLFGTACSCAQCYAYFDEWLRAYLGENGIPVKPGLLSLLDWLRGAGVRLALATSSNREKAIWYTGLAGITDYFDLLLGGDLVTRGKPDPQIFQMAAEQLGTTQPEQCVVLEDSLNGMLAANRGGFPVVIVPDVIDPAPNPDGLCFAKVKTLDEAIPLLRK